MSAGSVLLVAAGTALLALMFVPLERAFPARRQGVIRPELGLDAMFFAGQQLWSLLAIAILGACRRALAHAVPGHVLAAFSAQPLVLQAVEAVVLGDVLVYFWHRACHRSDFLWRFHAVHHSAEHLDWLAAFREHPLDGLTTQLAQNLPAFILGFPLYTIAGFAAFRGAWAIFIHSNTRLPLGPLRYLLGAPDLHHFHHARTVGEAANYANLAPWLDVLFGTYHRPSGPETWPLGVEPPAKRSYLGHLVAPFQRCRSRLPVR